MHIMVEYKFLVAKKSERENPLKQLLNPSPVDKAVTVAPEEDANTPPFLDCTLLEEVCGWINAKATVPVWAKMTPNITDFQSR